MENNVFFTSDLHVGHFNILQYCPNRLAAIGLTLNQELDDKERAITLMNEYILDVWNSTVRDNDEVYLLGDCKISGSETNKKVLSQLNGKKHLILGNHDKDKGIFSLFESVDSLTERVFLPSSFPFLNGDKFGVVMCHYPMLTWNHRAYGWAQVHGHCQGSIDGLNRKSGELRVDVGFDGSLGQMELVSVENLYNFFKTIAHSEGCEDLLSYASGQIKSKDDGLI